MDTSNKIIFILYDGAYGTTLRVDVKNKNQVKKMLCLIKKLANDEIKSINFANIDYAIMNDIDSFVLIKSDKNDVRIVDVNNFNITWRLNISQIYNVIGLIEIFLEEDSPGHQYLLQEDNLIIEFAYKEKIN